MLIAAFTLQSAGPSYALRPPQAETSDQRGGLEEALQGAPAPLPAVAAGLEEGIQQLFQVRSSLSNLPTYSRSTASVWGTLDHLLGSPEQAPGLVGEALQEYAETVEWMKQEYPDLGTPTSVERLTSAESTSVVGFKITTPKGLFVLAVQTRDTSAGGSAWAHLRLSEVQADAAYRLEEIGTGEVFPWDPPYHYNGSYLRGETDRFGNAKGQERWGVKPGDRKGDYQLFRVVEGDGDTLEVGWDDLLRAATPTRGTASQFFTRPTESQTHSLIKDPQSGIAADVVSGRPFSGGGAMLMFTFPNGNAGVGMRDTSASQPYEVRNLRVVSRLGGKQRGVQCEVRSLGKSASFDGVILDSVRYLREWNSWDGGRGRAARYQEFVDLVRGLPRRVLADLRREGVPLAELSRRVSPRVFYRRTSKEQRLYLFRLTLGGHLYIVEMAFPLSYKVEWTPQGKIDVHAGTSRHPLHWRMTVTTDFPALTPLPLQQLVRPEVLEAGAKSEALGEELQDLQFLAFKEFFAAGSHRFLQFFGRDTLYWLRLFGPLMTPEGNEIALQGVLDRVSKEGQVPSVEEMDDQAGFELMDGVCWSGRQMGQEGGMDKFYQAARALGEFSRGEMPPQFLKYGVPDVDVMLLPAMADYLRRQDIDPEQKAAFLDRQSRSGDSNLATLLKNADYVVGTASLHLKERGQGQPWPAGLVGVEKEGDFGNWRDVQYGIGYGLYPADVNGVLIPAAVQACREVLLAVISPPVGSQAKLERELASGRYPALAGLANDEDSELFGEFDEAWQGVRGRFRMPLSPAEIRARLNSYLQGLPPRERDWLLSQPLSSQLRVGHFLQADGPVPPVLQGGVNYFPVSLDRAGRPVAVASSDGILDLVDPRLPPWRLLEIVTPVMLPFPVGLWTPAGFVVASSALSTDERLRREITRTAYGGSVIYGWQMEFLKQGLYRQLQRPELEGDPQLTALLYSAFEACCDATPPQMTGQELWSWDVDEEGFQPVMFGHLPGQNDESNPIQLWSISSTEILRPQARQLAEQRSLPLLKDGEMLDSLAMLRQRYPAPQAGLEETRAQAAGLEEKPGISALSLSLPPGGGGVNIVFANQVALFNAAGYPLSVVGGQVIAMPPHLKAAPPQDNAYTRAGIQLHIIPEMDVNDDLQKMVREGRLDPAVFNQQVERMMGQIEEATADSQVILIHQYMTMPTNILVVEALGRLALKYQGRKRFVAWVHNALPGKEQAWPLTSITDLDPRMEYVAVSPQLRDQTLRLFGMERWPWMMSVIKNSISIMNFFDINPKVLSAYFDNRLYDAEYLFFYPARLVETKEVAGAIGAIKRMRDRKHDVRLVISTTGYEGRIPQEQRAYYNHLIALRDRLGLTDKEIVIYLHEPSPDDLKSQKEVRDWFFLCDALLFTSQIETAGIPVKEAKLAKRVIAHANYDVLNIETEGYPHVVRFPLREGWESEEGYGGMVGDRVSAFLESPAGLSGISLGRAQKHEIKQSLEGLLNLLSPWLNLPPPAKRRIQAGTRNFASANRLIEEAVHDARGAGYRSFEVNFEGFEPSSVDAGSLGVIREAAEGLRLTCRLTDFPGYPAERMEQVLRDAAAFAMETGAQWINIPAQGLDPARAALILRASDWAREEAAHRGLPDPGILFFVENAWQQPDGRWEIIPPDVLESYFAGEPVGLSLWVDSFRSWNEDGPRYYVDVAHLKLGTVYLGRDFFEATDLVLFERARALLVEMHRRHWEGDVIGQAIPAVPVRASGQEAVRRQEVMKIAFLNRVIDEAYLPAETSISLRENGQLVGPPSMVARAPETEAGLEEAGAGEAVAERRVPVAGLRQLVPGVNEAASLNQPLALLFDPSLVPGESDEAKQVELIGLAGSLRETMQWPREVPLELGLANEKTQWEGQGYRVIELQRDPATPEGTLPLAALPVVVAQALAAFRDRFAVDVAAYGELQEVTLPEVLATMTDLFA